MSTNLRDLLDDVGPPAPLDEDDRKEMRSIAEVMEVFAWVIRSYELTLVAREDEERCEGGCADPVAGHDVEGTPLCARCGDALNPEVQS